MKGAPFYHGNVVGPELHPKHRAFLTKVSYEITEEELNSADFVAIRERINSVAKRERIRRKLGYPTQGQIFLRALGDTFGYWVLGVEK